MDRPIGSHGSAAGVLRARWQSLGVQFATVDGTATSPATSGTVMFAPGQTTARIKVAVVADLVPEADETFTVQLSNPVGATLGDAVAFGRIRNDD